MGPAMFNSPMVCPPWRVIFDPSHALPRAWEEVRRSVLVNEAD